jgi:hypothetical protein
VKRIMIILIFISLTALSSCAEEDDGGVSTSVGSSSNNTWDSAVWDSAVWGD